MERLKRADPIGVLGWCGLLGLAFGACGVFPATTDRPDRAPIGAARRAALHSTLIPAPPVRLRSEEFRGIGTLEENLDRIRASAKESDVVHAMVQFDALPDADARGMLARQGLTLLQYLPDDAYFAAVAASANPEGWGALGVRWLGAIYPEDRMPARLAAGEIGEWAQRADGTADLRVKVFSDVTMEAAETALSDAGARILDRFPPAKRFTVNLSPDLIRPLAQVDVVRWIEEVPPPSEPLLDQLRAGIGAEAAWEPPYDLSGEGVTVGLWDPGLVDPSHADFEGRVTMGDPLTSDNISEHATHVAGILAGSGGRSESQGGEAGQWRGVAPAARIIAYDNVDEPVEHEAAIRDHRIVISQNSWGVRVDKFFGNCHLLGDYSYGAPEYDAIVNGTMFGGRVSMVFSAGNARSPLLEPCTLSSYATIPGPATAKNVVAVGAINSNDGSMTEFSSWGPVDDGRLKPDLVAPGSQVGGDGGVTSTYPGNIYRVLRGTSMAAPAVSGAIALLVEDYRRLYNGQDPRPSLVKALLLHTAEDLDDATTWFQPGPDYASGYGRLRITEAVDHLRSEGFLLGSISHGEVRTYSLDVPEGTRHVKLTLVWDDAPAAENVAVTLVNDLDLVVYTPDLQRYHPWTLAPGDPAAPARRDRVDRLNVVEQVLAEGDLPAGEWRILVAGHRIPGGEAQRFSLVFEPALIPPPATLELGEIGLDEATIGNGNGVLDPGETVFATVALRNTDGPTATGVSTLLSTDTTGVAILDAGSDYPELRPGESADNLAPFAFRLAQDLPCGSEIRFQHVATTTKGYRTTNVFIQVVGEFGVTNLATGEFEALDLPLAIPDGGSRSMPLAIEESGLVEEIGVSVRIDHPWGGDLAMVLQHPDGTRVRLLSPDSVLGSNFGQGDCGTSGQRTVFDDQSTLPVNGAGAPFVGAYQPVEPLSAFHDKPLSGVWRLVVSDVLEDDAGQVLCWGIKVGYRQEGHTCQSYNRAPIAHPRELAVPHGITSRLQLQADDPDEDALTYMIVSSPDHGELSDFDPVTGAVMYTPADGYTGLDRLSFRVNDGYDDSPVAHVDLLVDEPRAELRLLQAADKTEIGVAEELVYTLAASNRGPNVATEVVLTDELPDHVRLIEVVLSEGGWELNGRTLVCALGAIPAGEMAWATVTVEVLTAGPFTNTVVLSALEADSDLSDNVARLVLEASTSVDLIASALTPASPLLLERPVTLVFQAVNQGPSPARDVNLTIQLSPAFELLSANGAPPTLDEEGAVVQNFGSLPANTVVYAQLKVQPLQTGTFTNVVRISAEGPDSNPADNVVESVLEVLPSANLQIAQTPSLEPAWLDREFAYTITVTNLGPSTATGVRVVDTLPEAFQILSVEPDSLPWQIDGRTVSIELGDLAPRNGTALAVNLRPDEPGDHTHTVEVTSDTPDPDPSDNLDASPITVVPVANLAVRQTATPFPALPGKPVTYAITVTNLGPHQARGVALESSVPVGVSLVQAASSQGVATLEGGVLLAQLGNLDVSASAVVTLSMTPENPGNLTNTVTVQSGSIDPIPSDNAITNIVPVQPGADLALGVRFDSAAQAVGGDLRLNLVVTNSGPALAPRVELRGTMTGPWELVSLTTSHGEATWVTMEGLVADLGDLEVGEHATVEAIVRGWEVGQLQASFLAASASSDPVPDNNAMLAGASILPRAELTLVAESHPSTVQAGQPFAYGLIVTNAGPHEAVGVNLVADPAEGLVFESVEVIQGSGEIADGALTVDLGDLPAGATTRIVLVARASQVGEATQVIMVGTATRELDLADNSVSLTSTVLPSADVALTASLPSGPLPLGERIRYALTIENLGPSEASSIVLRHELPDLLELLETTASGGEVGVRDGVVTFLIPSLAIGEARMIEFQARALANTTGSGRAEVGSDVFDPVPDNNFLDLEFRALPPADLGLALKANPTEVLQGDEVLFRLTVTNAGPSDAEAVVIEGNLPPGMRFVVDETAPGEVLADGTAVTAALGRLASGAHVALDIRAEAVASGVWTNTFSVRADVGELAPDDNVAEAVVVVDPLVDLELSAEPSEVPAGFGRPFTVKIVATNHGPGLATDVTVTNVVSGPTDVLEISVTQGTFVSDSVAKTLDWACGDLPPGVIAVATLKLMPLQQGEFSFVADGYASQADARPGNNHLEGVVAIRPDANLGVAVGTETPRVIVGDQVTYMTIVTNKGPYAAQKVLLRQQLPAVGQLVQVDLTSGTWEIEDRTVSVRLGPLEAGASERIEVVFRSAEFGALATTVEVSSSEADPDPTDNFATTESYARHRTELAITAVTDADPIWQGAEVTHRVSVVNNGGQTANLVTVTNTLPTGIELVSVETSQGSHARVEEHVRLDFGDLAPGAEATASVTLRATEAGAFTNVFLLSSGSLETQFDDNVAEVGMTVLSVADLAILPFDTSPEVPYGFTAELFLVVTNLGPTLAREVVLTDFLPPGATPLMVESSQGESRIEGDTVISELGDLAAHAIAEVRLSVSFKGEGSVTNLARVNSANGDPAPENNELRTSIRILRVTDLSLLVEAPPVVVPVGGGLTFTLNVVNRGPSTASSVVVTDTLPRGLTVIEVETSAGTTEQTDEAIQWSIGSMAPGEEVSLLLVLQGVPEGTHTNRVEVLGAEIDPDPANNITRSVHSAYQEADLSVGVRPFPSGVPVGGRLTHIVQVYNRGPVEAPATTLTLRLPPSLAVTEVGGPDTYVVEANLFQWQLGDLAPNEGVVLTVTADAGGVGEYTARAELNSAVFDPELSDNAIETRFQVHALAILAVTQESSLSPAMVGLLVTNTVTVANLGETPAPNVELLTAYSLNAEILGATVERGRLVISGSGIVYTLGSIAPGEVLRLTGVTRIDRSGRLVAQATVFSPAIDFNDPRVSSRLVVPIIDEPTLLIHQSGSRLTLRWPVVAEDYIPEVTDRLNPPQWTRLRNPIEIAGQFYEVVLKSSGSRSFFRLRRP